MLAVIWVSGCQLNQHLNSFQKQTNKTPNPKGHVDVKARNFFVFINLDVLHIVSQTVSCVVAVSKMIGFG